MDLVVLMYSVMMVHCLHSVMAKGEFTCNLFSAYKTFQSRTALLSNLAYLIMNRAFQPSDIQGIMQSITA
jgi:hypothetical protein